MLNDTTYVEPPSIISIDLMPQRPAKPQTPYQVLRLLPKDATPAQQDSAIQAWFSPAEIHYSERPDTLHLPGEDIPQNLRDVELPQYYRETFFSSSNMYHPEIDSSRNGVAGDPVPDTLSNDSFITALLVLCFLLIMVTYSRISGFIIRQTKDFFYTQKGNHTITETGNEIKLQIVFTIITCLIYALLYYLYVINHVTDTFILSSNYALIGIFFSVVAGYFLLRFLLYTIVNGVMFDFGRNKKFLTSLIFISSLEGVLLFPIVLLQTYYPLPLQNAAYYCIAVLFFIKILTFYKTHIIFFRQKELYVQIILYFCALEMVPLFALWGGLAVIVDRLRVIF